MKVAYQQPSVGNPALLGVKLTVSFRRYSDEKDFSKSWAYVTLSQPTAAVLYNASSPFDDQGPPEVRDRTLTLREVMPFIDSQSHWEEATVRLGGR
jgi:hypothetical protein